MNTTYKQQIEAIQKARTAIENLIDRNGERVRLKSSVDECKKIIAGLNDAGSSLAALNLSDPYKEIERLQAELELYKAAYEKSLDSSKL